MALKPGRCYKRVKRPYTRVSIRKPRRSYVKGVPGSRIQRFESGDSKAKFPAAFHLVSKNKVQVRSNSLEAARVAANKDLTKKLGDKNFFLKTRVYPHQVIRDKPIATGAGADRFSQGMRHSFGHPAGVAALVKKDQKIMTVFVEEGSENIVKEAFRKAATKLPCSCKFVAD